MCAHNTHTSIHMHKCMHVHTHTLTLSLSHSGSKPRATWFGKDRNSREGRIPLSDGGKEEHARPWRAERRSVCVAMRRNSTGSVQVKLILNNIWCKWRRKNKKCARQEVSHGAITETIYFQVSAEELLSPERLDSHSSWWFVAHSQLPTQTLLLTRIHAQTLFWLHSRDYNSQRPCRRSSGSLQANTEFPLSFLQFFFSFLSTSSPFLIHTQKSYDSSCEPKKHL